MNKSKARILSLLTALLMLISVFPALAEAPAAPLNEPLQDSNIRVDMSVKLSPQLAGILSLVNPEPMDEATMSAISTVVSAFNKLTTSIIISKDAASGVIGTPVAPVIEFQASKNDQTRENGLTSNLLPGLVLSVDPGVLESVLAQAAMPDIDPEQVSKLALPYQNAVTEYVNEHLMTLEREEGAFVNAEYGTFDKRFQATLTTHMAADLMLRLAAVYKEDTAAQQFIKSITEASQTAMAEAPGTGTKPSEEEMPDIAAELEKAANEIKAKPDQPIITGWVYESANALYIDGVSPEESDMPFKLDILIEKQNGQDLLKVKLIGKGTSYTVTPESTEIKPIDWAEVEKGIMDRSDFSSVLMNLEVNTSETVQARDSKVNLAVTAQGMYFGMNMTANSNLESHAENAVIGISLFSPEPMLTLSVSSAPTDELPAGLILEGAVPLVIKEEGLGEEENVLLENTLQQALPALIERLLIALPDEAAAIMQLMESMNPEPSMMPPAEMPTVELLPAPSPVSP